MTDKYDLSGIDSLPAAPAAPASAKYDLGAIDAIPEATGFDKSAALFTAAFGNPSEEAQKRRLSSDITRIVGAYEPVLDVKEGMRRHQQLEADHATRASPRTSAFLSVPENAAVAIQDAKTMAQIEAIIGGDPLRSMEIAAKRMALSTGALGAKVGFDAPAVATDIIGESLRGVGLSDEYNVFKAMSASARRQAVATRNAIEYLTPEARNIVERAAASAGESAGMSLQLAPIAAMTPQGAGMAAAFGVTTFAESYTKAREAGKGPLDSLKYAIPQGAFEGLFEMAPAAFLADAIKNAPGLKQFTLGLIGKEVPTELATTLSQNLNDWVTFNPGKSVADFIAEQPEALAETAIATVMGASIQAGLIHGAQRVTGQFHAMQEERRAKQLQETLTGLMDQAKNVKSDPVTFQNFMAGVTDNATVFINADALQDTLAQNKMDVSVLPSLAEQLAQPSVTGDVEVPIGELMTAFAGTPAQEQVVQHARVRQDDLSAAEQAQFGDMGAFFKKQGEAVMEKQKANEQFVSEVKAIEDELTKELEALPPLREKPFKPHELRAQARVIASMYGALADMAGMSPAEARAMTRPNILGPDGAAPPRAATVTLGAPSTISWRSGKYTFTETRTYEHRADDGRVSRTTVDEDGNTKKEWLIVKKDGAEVWSDGDQLRKDDDYANVTPQRAQEIANEDLPAGATDTAPSADNLSQGFDHGEPMVNIGLDIGDVQNALSEQDAIAMLQSFGVSVTKSKVQNLTHDWGKENTLVAHLDRALTPDEMTQLMAATQQEAIPQYEGGIGTLYHATPEAAEKWGPFNPEYFRDLEGVSLLDSQKELGQKKTKAPKITEILAGRVVEQSKPLSAKQWADVREIALEALTPEARENWLARESEMLAREERANREAEVLKEKAQASLDKMPKPRLSTVPLLHSGQKLKIVGTGKNGKIRVPDVGRALYNKFLGSAGDISTEEGVETVARALAHEALASMAKDGHAVGWYDRKVHEALLISSLIHPELATDPRANLAFRLIAAVTSNGQAVRDNFILTNEVYAQWKATGQFPTELASEAFTQEGDEDAQIDGELEVDEEGNPVLIGGGQRRQAMVIAFQKLNALAAERGWENLEADLMQLRTVGEIKKFFDVKFSGELVDTLVPSAVGLGGPKIGNFFANLSGWFDTPTMDLWFMRTVGRMTGGLLSTKKSLVKSLKQLRNILPEQGEVWGHDVGKMRAEIQKYLELPEPQQLDPEVTLKTLKVTSTYARAQYSKFSAPDPVTEKTFTDKSPANLNARSLIGQMGAMVEAPGNGTERNQLRSVVYRTLELLEKQGVKLTAADLQAVLWYHEKNLYSQLGDISESAKPWDYASAARFGVGRALGLVDVGARQRAKPVGEGQPAGELQPGGVQGSDQVLAQLNRNVGAVAGPVVGIHYSKAPRTSLSSGAFGTGMPGAERERIAASTDPRIKQRVAFYVNTGNGIKPEDGVGSHAHTATLRNLYDADADALKIWKNAGDDMNAAESAVLDAGFDGYLTRGFGKQGAVVMLGRRDIAAASVKPADVSTVAEQPPSPEIPKMKQAAMAIMQNRALPNGQQSAASWKRDLERSDPDTAALIAWDKIPAGDYYKDQIAGQLWQTTFKPVDTESAEFKKWFGDSKVVDAEGKPLVVYHGTAADVAAFDLARSGENYPTTGGGHGVFLTSRPGTAGAYAEQAGYGEGDNVMPLYVSLQNPIVIETKEIADRYFDYNRNKIYARAEKAGADGIIVRGAGRDLIVAFAPTQIKSAISNTGEFSDTNPSILFAEAAGPRRGSFNPLTFDLRLLADANRSTFIHEASHFFMAAYIDMASQPDAPPALKQYVEDLLGYLFKNVPGGEQAGGVGLGQKVGAGETALLAPNGKPSKLNAQQWAQVRTPEFKAWFGDWEKHARAKNPVGSLWSDDSVSKIVDENGEPLVVYHGTQQGGFDIFRPEKGDKHRSPMLFATADPGTARSYSGKSNEIEALDAQALDRWEKLRSAAAYNEKKLTKAERAELRNLDDLFNHENGGETESQRGIYHLFLNIKNPNETDFEGANWDGKLQEPIYELQKDDEYIGEYAYTLEDAERALEDGRADNWVQVDETGETTNSVAEEALRFKQDGAIIRNVTDDGGKHGYGVDPSDVFVFFDSNQVKSATQNTGAFSRTDDSILRQDGQPTTPGAIPEGRTNIERWNAMTLDQQRAYWEFFAEGWEQYAMSGKAPTKALQSAFSAFAKWMKEIYKTLKNFVTMHGTKPLDAELTQYFDRMLATDEELEAARAERGFQALFKNLAESGMSPGQFADYMALDQLQKTEAEELLRSRSIRDMKWLSNAKSKAIKEIQAEADELRNLVRAGVEEELANTPIRQAERWLRKGLMVQDGEQIVATAGFKLDSDIVKTLFPQGAIDSVDLSRLKQMMASTGTQHPDDVAKLFDGFRNGEHLVRELLAMPAFKDEVAHLTDLRMLEEHGDLATPEAIEKAADEAIHNDAHLKMVATEVWALTNRTGSVAMLTKAAKAFASNLVDNTVVKKLSPVQFVNAATRAGKAAVRAMAKKDTDKAASEKRVEMVNAAAAKEAYAAEAEVRAIMTRLRKIAAYSDKHSSITSREFGVVQAVRAILAEFEIGSHGEKATKYLKTLSEYDPTLGAVLDDTIEQLAPESKPWPELKVADLRELHAAVTGLWRVAKEVRSVELAGEKMSLDDARAQLIAKLEETGAKDRQSKAFSLTDAEIRNQDFQSYAAKAIRPENWVSMKDGLDEYGPWRRLIWNTIDRAQLDYNADKGEKLKQLKALLVPIMADMTDIQIDAPELGGSFGAGSVIGYSELLHAILHTGNTSNKTKLLVGRGWGSLREDGSVDSTKWDAFMKRMWAEGKITKTHMDFVQGVWDLLESMKEGAQKAHRATTGRYFEEIEAAEIVTPFGVYRGGYAPAIVDRRQVADMDIRKLQEAAEMDVVHSFDKPAGGFTKSRVQNYNQKLELNIAALGRHIDQVLLFSHMSGPVRNVQRVLKGKDLSNALAEADRAAMAHVLAPWLHSAATQTVTEKGKLSYENMALFTKLRSRAGMALMFANVSNSLQQLTSFFPAMLEVGKKDLLFAAAKGWYRPREMAASIAAMSPYMKQRLDNEVHAMAEEIDQILLNPTKFEKAQDWAVAHSYFLQMAVDTVMSPIIWQAKFNEATARGAEKQEAIDLADAVVRKSQGSNRAIDIAAMEKGSPFYRMFMQFAGYFNSQINLIGEKLAREKLMPKTPAKYARIGMILAQGWWAPAITSMAIALAMRGGPDDEDGDGLWDDWLTELLLGTIKYATAAVPVFGQAINATVNAFNDKPYDDRMSLSPAVGLIDASIRGGQAAVKSLEDPTKAGRAVRDLGSFLSLFGVPVTPITKAVGYATDVSTGKVSPTSGADYARGIVTGVASPESKQ